MVEPARCLLRARPAFHPVQHGVVPEDAPILRRRSVIVVLALMAHGEDGDGALVLDFVQGHVPTAFLSL